MSERTPNIPERVIFREPWHVPNSDRRSQLASQAFVGTMKAVLRKIIQKRKIDNILETNNWVQYWKTSLSLILYLSGKLRAIIYYYNMYKYIRKYFLKSSHITQNYFKSLSIILGSIWRWDDLLKQLVRGKMLSTWLIGDIMNLLLEQSYFNINLSKFKGYQGFFQSIKYWSISLKLFLF